MKHLQIWLSQFFTSSHKSVFRLLSFMAMLASILVAPMAYAVPTIGQIGSYQQQTATGLAGGLYYFALFFGLLMVVVGIIMWGYAHKKHESPMIAIVIIIAGILLASVMAVIQSGSATVFQGSTQSQVQTLNLP
jgi:hypothetical protein